MMRTLGAGLAIIMALADAAPASARAPINSNVAIQPATGGFILRQQFRYTEASLDTASANLDFQVITESTTLVYGVTSKLTFIANIPATLNFDTTNNTTGERASTSGLADITLLTKIRLYRDDFGVNDTSRFDLIAGAELPTGADRFTRDSINPIIGGVYSHLQGRHAFHTDLLWKFNTGGGDTGADLLRYDAAYTFRIAPERYATNNPTAWFGIIELNGFSETNSDNELFLSPGIRYTTTRWTIEATVQLPVWQELDHRPERDFILGVGFRMRW